MNRTYGVLACAMLAACGGSQGIAAFSTSWQDDGGRSVEAVRQRLATVAIPLGADVAVGVAGHGTKLVGQPLGPGGGARWTFAHALSSRPVLAGRVVVVTGGGELMALDAGTGKLLWTHTVGPLELRGAGDDGTITAVTMTSASGGSTFLAVDRSGAVVQKLEPATALGAPAVVGRLAFVPWAHQYVSVVDLDRGDEVGRVLLRESTSRAWVSGGALYFGEHGIFRWNDKIKDAAHKGGEHLALPQLNLPGQPLLMRPGEETPRPMATAADKIRTYARLTPSGEPLRFDADRLYATYFRLVLGLSADHAGLAWVHAHTSDVIGGAVAKGALVICDAAGKLTTLDARNGGQIGAVLDLGESLDSCAVQAEGLAETGHPSEPGSLVQQVRIALADRDLELAAGQIVLLRELATLADESATDLLIQIAVDPRSPPPILEEARTALAARRNGARSMLAALEKRYDFLHDVTNPPPVGPIARALAAMHDTSAAHVLTTHLFEPADTDGDVRDVAQALTGLATPAEAPLLFRFFAFYRDAPTDPEEVPLAVDAVAETLLRVGGPEGRVVIERAVQAPGTNAAIRAKLSALLDALAVRPAAGSQPR